MAKTELLIHPSKPGPTTSFLTVVSTISHPVAQACCLGVTLDSSHSPLTFKTFLKSVAFSSVISQKYTVPLLLDCLNSDSGSHSLPF
ncbi:hypothetical protein FKM82_001400 [Ascaphus truei]